MKPLNSTGMLVAMARGDFPPDVLAALQRAALASLREGGTIGADRLLGWPTTPRGRKRARRDYWLLVAAAGLADGDGQATAGVVHRALEQFISRGPWRVWRTLPEPPAGSARLNVALWHVARATSGKGLSLRHVANILAMQRIDPEIAAQSDHTEILTNP